MCIIRTASILWPLYRSTCASQHSWRVVLLPAGVFGWAEDDGFQYVLYILLCHNYVVNAQSTEKWLQMDRKLLAMTENVDYDVEGMANNYFTEILHIGNN